MEDINKNYYNTLCSQMYDILHNEAPEDELNFYLSYADKNQNILEPMCGNGRFMIPFIQKGYNIYGIDLSSQMLNKLKEKVPDAQVSCIDILNFMPNTLYDYIFIPSGSISLFTDIDLCLAVLKKIKSMLSANGKFVFAVDTIAARQIDNDDYTITTSVKTEQDCELILKNKSYYDEKSQTQYLPSIYELHQNATILQTEYMDFQIHLYKSGEMEKYLRETGFKNIFTFSSFNKDISAGNNSEMFIFECSN